MSEADKVVPLSEATPQWADSFVNLLSGLGVVGRDKFASQNYVYAPMSVQDLEFAYRGDWIARKVVQVPAWDMTREWRAWQADPDQIELLEASEKRLCLQQKLQDALTKARLYGGAAIIVGVDAGNPEDELNLDAVARDGLRFLHIVSRHQVRAGPIIRDISSKYFGQPTYYEAISEPNSPGFVEKPDRTSPRAFKKAQVRLHPSRVIRLIGLDAADAMLRDVWGDSALQPVSDAIKMAGLVTGSLATLISELKFDIIKVPGLKNILSTEAGTRKMLKRFQASNVAKSVINTVMLDGDEEWQRIQVALAGVSDLIMTYMQIAAGAADIPATRFLGMAPKGLNSTGESDIRNYYDRLAAEQTTLLTPAINTLDEVLIRSALGERPPEVWYEWNSLWQLSASEKADIALKKAQAYQIDVNTGQLPPVALAHARANQLMEDGVYPGLEKALEDAALEGDTIEEQNAPAPAPVLPFGIPPGAAGGAPGAPGGGAPPVGTPVKPGNPFAPKKPALALVGRDGVAAEHDDHNPYHKGPGEGGGQFASKAGGGGGAAGSAGAGKAIKAFVQGPGRDVIKRAASTLKENHRELLGTAVSTALTQVTGSLPSEVEDGVKAEVVNFAENARVSVAMARDLMRTAVKGLIALRRIKKDSAFVGDQDEDDDEEGDDDPVLDALQRLEALLDDDELFDDHNPNHKPAGPGGGQFASKAGGGGGGGKAGESRAKPTKTAKTSSLGGKVETIAKGLAAVGEAVEAVAQVGRVVGALMRAVKPNAFVKARGGSTRPAFLSASSAKDLADHRLFLSEKKTSGYALDQQGDLQNLFNHGVRDGGKAALVDAIKQGATTLDAFDGHLPELYADHGFVPTGRMKFNEEYAPAGWDYARYGKPDIVFMAYQGGDRSTIEQRVGAFKPYDRTEGSYYTDFDLAKAASRRQIVDHRPEPEVSAVDGARSEHRGRRELREELADAPGRSAQAGARLRRLSDHNPHHRGPGPGGGQFTTGPGGGGGGGAGGSAGKAGSKTGEVPHLKSPAKVEARAKAGVADGSRAALARGVVPLKGSQGHPNTIASRLITAKGADKTLYTQPSVEAMRTNPEAFAHNIGLFRNPTFYPNFKRGELTGNPDHDAPTILDHFKKNLKFLHDVASAVHGVASAVHEAKLWYDGARNIAQARAEQHGLDDASVAGVYAALSPQKDWDQNVHLGDRILDIHAKQQDTKWDPKMSETAARIWRQPAQQKVAAQIAGKRLRDLGTLEEKAIWTRTHDEAHSPRHYQSVRPDGSKGDFVTTQKGERATAAWGPVTTIMHAIGSLESKGDHAVISEHMGDKHKVRSFFNNILDPHSANGDTTIDTHAVGASLLQPLSGATAPVHHNFGTSPIIAEKPAGFVAATNSSVTGAKGTYGLYSTADREASKELGLQPRQLQSITWVTKRDLFDRTMTDKQKGAIAETWNTYHTDYGVSLEATQRRIMRIMGRT